jgi:hypothetical protein
LRTSKKVTKTKSTSKLTIAAFGAFLSDATVPALVAIAIFRAFLSHAVSSAVSAIAILQTFFPLAGCHREWVGAESRTCGAWSRIRSVPGTTAAVEPATALGAVGPDTVGSALFPCERQQYKAMDSNKYECEWEFGFGFG